MYLDVLKEQFNSRVDFKEKRPGIMQLIAPFYHEDGDMVDIFLTETPSGKIQVCDYGMTLMRLSYSYDLDTPNKERIFTKILSENQVYEDNGNIYIETDPGRLYDSILRFSQTVAKVSNMRLYKREVIKSLFYEMLAEFVMHDLRKYNPTPDVYPVENREELEIDYRLDAGRRPVFLFAVKDATKARLATISCLEFQRAKIPHRSVVIHEDFEGLSRKDQGRITSAVDKQFISLDDFKTNAENYLEREIAS